MLYFEKDVASVEFLQSWADRMQQGLETQGIWAKARETRDVSPNKDKTQGNLITYSFIDLKSFRERRYNLLCEPPEPGPR